MQNKIVFWDWNGTLLDDVDLCVASMNNMLQKRGMSEITHNYYKEIFNFPVIEYYKKLGFNFDVESFENLSVEFIEGYNNLIDNSRLHASAISALEYFHHKGIKQVIISAMEQQMLLSLLNKFKIKDFFDEVKGLDNIYASSKTHLAKNYIDEKNINPEQILFIGDTLHDAEVAKEIGSKLVLVSNGHHSYNRLTKYHSPVIKDLTFLPTILN